MKRIFIALLGGFFCITTASRWEPFSADLQYNEVCYLTSHNSYAAVEHGYVYAQQTLSIKKQLAHGVRGLMLDVCEDKKELFLVHKSPFLTRLISRGKHPMRFSSALETIRSFLEEHPQEVLTIFLEDFSKNGALLDQTLHNAGLKKYVLTNKDWNLSDGWPTFNWMRKTDKRLVIFNLRDSSELTFPEWKHVIENQWGTLHPVRACRERRESRRYLSEDRSLYLLNYFPMFNLSFDNSYHKINTEGLDTFLERALVHGLDTQSHKTHLPTFICTDHVHIGNGMQHVQKINALKHEQRQAALVLN